MQKRKPGPFTDKEIKNLQPESKEYWQREGQGFSIRVLPSGEKSWYFIYTFLGRKRFMKLGNYDPKFETTGQDGKKMGSLAYHRQKCAEARSLLVQGIDPLDAEKDQLQIAIEQRKSHTFDELAKAYITDNIEGQVVDRSVYDIKRVLLGSDKADTLDDFKDWRKRKANTITQEDAATLLKNVAKRSAASARNIIKAARPMFVYAMARGITIINPFQMAQVKTFLPAKIKSELKPTVKNRILTEDEIKTLWKALQGKCIGSAEAKNAIRLMLLLGQRPTEVLGLHSGEIKDSWWTIPKERTKSRLDKNRRDHTVYLTQEALSLIGTQKGLVFESRNKTSEGNKEHISVNSIGNFIRKNGYFGLAPWGAHDLRRTMRTYMSDIDGISARAAEAVMNHAQEGTKKNYDHHKYLRQIETALTLWRDKLVEIVGDPLVKALPDNVIPIKVKAA